MTDNKNMWSNYTTKETTPVDNDELMIYDSEGKNNKKLLFGGFWKWIAKKLKEAELADLETDNKTVVGAINYLYGKTAENFKAFGFVNQKTITIKSAARDMTYGVLIITINKGDNSYPLKFNVSPTLNKTIDNISAIAENETTVVITLPENMTHGLILAGGSISGAIFTAN